MRKENINLAILFLVSVLLSIYLFFRTYVISLDGAFQYVPIARDFALGLFKKALGHDQQPLYSLFVALMSQWVVDFELSGKLVSLFFGILLVFPVYFLGKRIFDERIAFISGFFFLIHPYVRRFSADVLKESTYLFFLSTALWFSWRTLQGEKRLPYLLIPLFSVLAYLVRPDGIEVFLVVFFYLLFIKKFSASKEKWPSILLLLLSSILLFLPYLVHLREGSGALTLSRSKGILEFLGLGMMKGEVNVIDKILFSIKILHLEILSTYHPLYLLLWAIGFITRASSHLKEGEKFLLSFLILHYVVLFLLILNFTDWSDKEETRFVAFSGRHVLPLLLFSIYWVGEGFGTAYCWIYKKTQSYWVFLHDDSKRRSTIFGVLLFALVSAVILPKTLMPQRYERLPEKWAGRWIKDRLGENLTIFTSAPRIAFYAGGNYELINFSRDRMEKVNNTMREKGGLYLAIREKERGRFNDVAEAVKRDFIEVNQFKGKGMEKVLLYKRIH